MDFGGAAVADRFKVFDAWFGDLDGWWSAGEGPWFSGAVGRPFWRGYKRG